MIRTESTLQFIVNHTRCVWIVRFPRDTILRSQELESRAKYDTWSIDDEFDIRISSSERESYPFSTCLKCICNDICIRHRRCARWEYWGDSCIGEGNISCIIHRKERWSEDLTTPYTRVYQDIECSWEDDRSCRA